MTNYILLYKLIILTYSEIEKENEDFHTNYIFLENKTFKFLQNQILK